MHVWYFFCIILGCLADPTKSKFLQPPLILGPLLFYIFMLLLAQIMEACCHKYADDAQIYNFTARRFKNVYGNYKEIRAIILVLGTWNSPKRSKTFIFYTIFLMVFECFSFATLNFKFTGLWLNKYGQHASLTHFLVFMLVCSLYLVALHYSWAHQKDPLKQKESRLFSSPSSKLKILNCFSFLILKKRAQWKRTKYAFSKEKRIAGTLLDYIVI